MQTQLNPFCWSSIPREVYDSSTWLECFSRRVTLKLQECGSRKHHIGKAELGSWATCLSYTFAENAEVMTIHSVIMPTSLFSRVPIIDTPHHNWKQNHVKTVHFSLCSASSVTTTCGTAYRMPGMKGKSFLVLCKVLNMLPLITDFSISPSRIPTT